MTDLALRPTIPTALQLLGHTGPPPRDNPAILYLSRLQSPQSQRTIAASLGTLASIILQLERDPGETPQDFYLRCRRAALDVPWGRIRRPEALRIASILAQTCGAPATANKHLTALRKVLEEAWLAGQMPAEDYHRAVKLDPVKGRRARPGHAISRGDLRAVVAACHHDESPVGARDVGLLAVLYATGARRSEASALDLEHWDSQARQLRLLRKRNKEQLVPLLDVRGQMLDVWVSVRGAWPGPLFVGARKGGRLTRERLGDRGIQKVLERRCLQAGVKPIRPHDFRRTLIGDMLDSGIDLVTVQKFVDHVSVATTASYDRRDERAIRAAAGQISMPWLGPHPAARAG